MKLSSFRIINCFGFRDSGEIDFENPNNFIYLLGRNSSGKSSLLNAIDYFELNKVPSEHPNFRNFKDTTETPSLTATFRLEGSELAYSKFADKLNEIFLELDFNEAALKHDNRLKILLDTIGSTYKELFSTFNREGKFSVMKLGNGSYHVFSGNFEAYSERKTKIQTTINEASQQGDGKTFNIAGNERPKDITFQMFENLIIYQLPVIYIFDKKHPLNESLPNLIEKNWKQKVNELTKTFISYLDAEKLDLWFVSTDPADRDELLLILRRKLDKLMEKINQHPSNPKTQDLISMRIDPGANSPGLQVTVETNGKGPSSYSQISENTKFLFAYHLYSLDGLEGNHILLFDEPNNGFHPTAQMQMRGFLQDLGKSDNQVVVSTHSEYMIDPDYLASVRIMTSDPQRYIAVRNHFTTKSEKGEKGDFLALQPIFDAIGYKYGNQLEIGQDVIITEGVTDLFYLRAFKKILNIPGSMNIAPGRGEGTIPHLLAFLISQSLNLKVVVDKGAIRDHLKTEFGLEDKFIKEVPIPAEFEGKMVGSGIEDLFSKKDFENILGLIGHNVESNYKNVSNSHYMSHANRKLQKRILALKFLGTNEYDQKSFEKETINNFRDVLEFCHNDDWFSL